MLKSKSKKIEGRKIGIRDLMTNKFKINIERVKFWFQYTFRSESIEYLFYKDFICATMVVIIFQFINFQYLELFRQRVYRDLESEQAKEDKVNENLEVYNGYNFIGTIIAFSLCYSFFMKIIFNSVSKEKLPFDKWTLMDGV